MNLQTQLPISPNEPLPFISRIHRLSPLTINRIAAGEVIERPASILKELVENAIDAQSTAISAHFGESDPWKISVVDNGSGMSSHELQLALERHATSKIETEDDLVGVKTHGFRGEALPSIASIAEVTLESRTPDSMVGSKLITSFGNPALPRECACPVGTHISVGRIFENTPVRQKFLKRYSSEASHVLSQFYTLALAYPDIDFKLFKGQELIYHFNKGDDLLVRCRTVFGKETAEHCKTISTNIGYVRISGIVGNPELTRSNTRGILLYVNRRAIRDKNLVYAVAQAYRSFIPRGSYPVAILMLELPGEEVEVNVHPAKTEVRFREASQVFRAIYRAVSSSFTPNTLPSESFTGFSDGLFSMPETHAPQKLCTSFFAEKFNFGADTEPLPPAVPFFQDLQIIGQFQASYILCESSEKVLYVIDQHALAERISFEHLRRSFKSDVMAAQRLLIPMAIELDRHQMAVIPEYIPMFHRLGFELEIFGPETVILKSTPAILRNFNSERVVRELIEEVLSEFQPHAIDHEIEKIASLIACKNSIRARDHLSSETIYGFFRELDSLRVGLTCPHGRPFVKEISLGEIEGWFHR
jgi:DNA mismatch repair protein MutL